MVEALRCRDLAIDTATAQIIAEASGRRNGWVDSGEERPQNEAEAAANDRYDATAADPRIGVSLKFDLGQSW